MSSNINIHQDTLHTPFQTHPMAFGSVDDNSVLNESRDIKQFAGDKNSSFYPSPYISSRQVPSPPGKKRPSRDRAVRSTTDDYTYASNNSSAVVEKNPLFFHAQPDLPIGAQHSQRGEYPHMHTGMCISIGCSPLSAACATDLNPPLPRGWIAFVCSLPRYGSSAHGEPAESPRKPHD